MALNRESIERRDFPTARRGYDPAAVDAHLRALAGEVEALAQQAQRAGAPALGPTAATQVQGILDAAQATAAEIEREARSEARGIREEAAQDAERARAHVETLAQTTAALRARVETLDGEVNALAVSLRAAKGELSVAAPALQAPEPPSPIVTPAPAPPASVSAPEAVGATSSANRQRGNDLDGARLVALNMALSGESREQADRYLAENFELADPKRLLDEVYAAVGA
jgi:DivIVA domain-containing protein